MNIRDYRRYGFDTDEPLINREASMRIYLDSKFAEVNLIDYDKIKKSIDLSGLAALIDNLKKELQSGLSGLVIDYERLETHVTTTANEKTEEIIDAIEENAPNLCCVAHKCDIEKAVEELKEHTHTVIDDEIKPQFTTIYEQIRALQ